MSNKQNDIIRETAFDAHCEDMRMWAIEQQLEKLMNDMADDRLKLTAVRIQNLALIQAHKVLSGRLDKILGAIVIAEEEKLK